MILQLKKFIIALFLKLNLNVEMSTSKKDVNNLLSRIRPIKTDIELIRIGGDGDGGYLVPNILEEISACFSPGVGDTSAFEIQMAELGIPSHLMDWSVSAPPTVHPLISFEKKYLGYSDDSKFVSLKSWLKKHANESGDLILQMDIEGAEYEVIEKCTNDDLQRFRILIIEFHSFHSIIKKTGYQNILSVLDKILENFIVVHAHINNNDSSLKWRGDNIPKTLELTFLRKMSNVNHYEFAKLPNALDQKNNSRNPANPLPKVWKIRP